MPFLSKPTTGSPPVPRSRCHDQVRSYPELLHAYREHGVVDVALPVEADYRVSSCPEVALEVLDEERALPRGSAVDRDVRRYAGEVVVYHAHDYVIWVPRVDRYVRLGLVREPAEVPSDQYVPREGRCRAPEGHQNPCSARSLERGRRCLLPSRPLGFLDCSYALHLTGPAFVEGGGWVDAGEDELRPSRQHVGDEPGRLIPAEHRRRQRVPSLDLSRQHLDHRDQRHDQHDSEEQRPRSRKADSTHRNVVLGPLI